MLSSVESVRELVIQPVVLVADPQFQEMRRPIGCLAVG